MKISDEAILAAVNLSKRYIADRFLPDKAIDLIDEAAASAKLQVNRNGSGAVRNFEKQLALIIKQKELEVERQNYQKAAELKELAFSSRLEVSLLIENIVVGQMCFVLHS